MKTLRLSTAKKNYTLELPDAAFIPKCPECGEPYYLEKSGISMQVVGTSRGCTEVWIITVPLNCTRSDNHKNAWVFYHARLEFNFCDMQVFFCEDEDLADSKNLCDITDTHIENLIKLLGEPVRHLLTDHLFDRFTVQKG